MRHYEHSNLQIAMIGSRGISSCYSGLETHVRALACELARRGHYVCVYGRRDKHDPKLSLDEIGTMFSIHGIDGFYVPNKYFATISNSLWATFHALREMKYNLIHYHGVGCIAAMMLAQQQHIPTVLTLHSTNWQERKWPHLAQTLIHRCEREIVNSTDALITISESLATRIRQEYQRPCSVIPNGVNYKGSPEFDAAIIEQYQLTAGEFILYVGRVVPDKGCHVLLEAYQRANLPQKLVFAGRTDRSHYCRMLRNKASTRVLFTGNVNDVALGALYRGCRLFCSASISEGQPIAVLEALAHGAPSILSDIPAHAELVPQAEKRFPVGDVAALQAKLITYVSQTPFISHDCRQWIAEHKQYSIEVIAEQVLNVYRQACTNG